VKGAWGSVARARAGVATGLGGVATALALCGCQSTQKVSAELQRKAKHDVLAAQGASVTKQSPSITVVGSTVVHSSAGTAVVVRLRDRSTKTLEDAPIEITVRDKKGEALYQNNAPGLESSLTRVSLIAPGKEAVWVDDQVQTAGVSASASALVGEAEPATGIIPQLSVAGVHLSAEAGGEATTSGTVANHSRVTQQNLVVYAVARKGTTIVAAGRAVLAEVGPGASAPFQVYFVGDPRNAQIETSAPATTF
jgi:hypothetical protein